MKNFKIISITLFIISIMIGDILFADGGGYSTYALKRKLANASSILKEKGLPDSLYSAEKSIDGNVKTAWCSGGDHGGIGEWIHIEIPPTLMDKLGIADGIWVNRILHAQNNQIKDYELEVFLKNGRSVRKKGRLEANDCGFREDPMETGISSDDCERNLTIMDSPDCKKIIKKKQEGECGIIFGDKQGFVSHQHDLPYLKGIQLETHYCVTGFTLKIQSVYHGSKSNDTCITEFGGFSTNQHYIHVIKNGNFKDSSKEGKTKAQIIDCE